MARILEGQLEAKGIRIALVVARWNDPVTSRLLSGATDALLRHGGDRDALTVVHVPGSFELPLAAARLAATGRFDAIVALGALVRGETPHFDVLAAAVARGLAQAGMTAGIPVIFGVLTCDTMEQAMDRAGGKAGNKGWDAALAAIEMAGLYKRLD
ncbi:MAG TPA: 6,7-dimethyl-8-ribityllumazine synthase [Candidatus Polarisedimenticolaceae bacterium]|nr:6,7-dimethyl-8-ribityllumazine synthase [Candidatus Polarisedimenticolaceae bacterium]